MTDMIADQEPVFPGWYRDPDGRAVERFWNGRSWTGQERSRPTKNSVEAKQVAEPTKQAAEPTKKSVEPTKKSGVDPSPEATQQTLVETARKLAAVANGTADPQAKNPEQADEPSTSQASNESLPTRPITSQPSKNPIAKPVPTQKPITREAVSKEAIETQAVVRKQAASSKPAAKKIPLDKGSAINPTPTKKIAAKTTDAGGGVGGVEAVTKKATNGAVPVNAATKKATSADAVTKKAAPSEVVKHAPQLPDPTSARRVLAAIAIGSAVVAAFFVGLLVGNGSDDSGTETAETVQPETVQPDTAEPDTAESSVATTTEDSVLESVPGSSQAEFDEVAARVAELETSESVLAADLAAAEADAEAAQAEADNLAEHNVLLRSWFTTQVLNRSQGLWDAEVARGCALEAAPSLEELRYTRNLEVVGTPADLLAAVSDCRTA